MNDYPVKDFNLEIIEDDCFKITLFLNIKEASWVGVNDPSVYMYKYGMSRGLWNEKESAIELTTGYDGIRYILLLLKRYNAAIPSTLDSINNRLCDFLDFIPF